MLKIGTTLILSEAELKHYKKLILSKYPCKEEVAYRKKIEEQKKIIEDQGHELYNQNKTIEFLKSELDKKKEPVKTSTIKLNDMAQFATVDMHSTREEVCDMINKSLEEDKKARRIDDVEVILPIARANYQPLTGKYNDLKASYDNLLDEQRSLRSNNEKLNEAKLIIDALQKENADLKAKLSDREAHACSSVKDKEYVDLLEAYRELKGKYEEAVKDATLSMAEKQKLVDQIKHLQNEITKHRFEKYEYRSEATRMASIILEVDSLCEENRKYLVVRNKKYRISDELYSAIYTLITEGKCIASNYKKYIDAEEIEIDDNNNDEE